MSPLPAIQLVNDDLGLQLAHEEDDDLTRLRPWWKLGRFSNPSVERAYRQWHHMLWIPRLKVMYCLAAVVYFGAFLIQLMSRSSFRFLLMEVRPITKTPLMSTTSTSRAITVAMAVFILLPPTRKLVTPDRFQLFVFSGYTVPLIIEQSYSSISPQMFHGNLSDAPADAIPVFEAWAANPTGFVQQAYYNAILSDFYLMCLGALSGLLPELVLLGAVLATVLTQLQFERTYFSLDRLRREHDAGSSPAASLRQLWLYRAIPLVLITSIAVLIQTGQRKEFRVRLLLKRAKDARIEQLTQEKGRLDWDRKLAQQAAQAELAAKAEHAQASRHSGGGGGGGGGGSACCAHLRHGLVGAGGAEVDADEGSTAASCSEIEMALPQRALSIDGSTAASCSEIEMALPQPRCSEEGRLLPRPGGAVCGAARLQLRPTHSAAGSAISDSATTEDSFAGIGLTCETREAALDHTLRAAGLESAGLENALPK